MQGENGNGTPKAYVGRFSAGTESATGGTGSAAGGSITTGILDGMRVDQTGDNGGASTGSYTAPSSTTGRFTLTLTPTGGTSSITLVAYIIDANRMFVLETAGDTGVLVGDMRTQQQTSYSAANLTGAGVLYGQAYDGYSNGSVTGYDSSVYQISGNGAGTLTVNQSYDDNRGTYTAGKENGGALSVTFDPSNSGRATFSPGTDSAFLYFFNNNAAFYLDLNGSNNYLETGWLEAQSQTNFTDAALAGTYMMGGMPRPQEGDHSTVGEMIVGANGSVSGGVTDAGQGKFTWDQSFGATYSWDTSTTNTGTFLVASPASMSCAMISSTKSVCTDQNDSNPGVIILQQ
jgi:hypothetical protein